MPLHKGKSEKAFKENVRTEMHHGKPQKQALAIAYSVKRRSKKASGGAVESGSKDMNMADGGWAKPERYAVDKGTSSQGHAVRRANRSQDYSKSPNSSSPSIEREMAREDRETAKMRAYDRRKESRNIAGGASKKPLQGLAEGGEVNAKNERRPMPDNTYDDARMVSKNRHSKDNGEDGWTQNPTVKQAQSNNGRKVMPIKRPRMVPTDAFSTKLYDQEGNLQNSASPGPYDAKPDKSYDESGANRQGPSVPDMADEHSTHSKPYIKEIEDQYAQDIAEANMRRSNSYAKGGVIERKDHESHNINHRTQMEPADHGMEEIERDEQNDHLYQDEPSHDVHPSSAKLEEGPDRQGPDVPDMEDEHSTGRKPYAGGGKISDYGMEEHTEEDENPAHDKHSPNDSEDQPEEEHDMEDEDSIAAAIMAKKKHPASMSDSDMDEMMMLYEGGEITEHSGDILSHGSMDSDDSDQADLSRNHDEDANEEDQTSWNALRKENYNDSDLDIDNPRDAAMKGDSEESDSEDDHDEDMVSTIRSRMKKRQFKQR